MQRSARMNAEILINFIFSSSLIRKSEGFVAFGDRNIIRVSDEVYFGERIAGVEGISVYYEDAFTDLDGIERAASAESFFIY